MRWASRPGSRCPAGTWSPPRTRPSRRTPSGCSPAAAVAVVSAAHQGRDRGRVADIKGRGRGSTRPLPGQPARHTFRAVTVDVSHHDGVAPQNKCAGQRPPDARRSPRNDRYPGHTCLPVHMNIRAAAVRTTPNVVICSAILSARFRRVEQVLARCFLLFLEEELGRRPAVGADRWRPDGSPPAPPG